MAQQLVIVLHDNGQITVNGPINNKFLCFGMLELAKDAIREFSMQKNPLIVPEGANGDIVPPISRG